MTPEFEKLRALLDDQYSWPDHYTFKFVVPSHKREQLHQVLESSEHKERPSRSGKYISITAKIHLSSSQEVIEIYRQASKIEGIISL